MQDIQLSHLFDAFDKLQYIHGDKKLFSVYGAGCKKNPKLFLLFMNPTGRNISCIKDWKGIRAPRLGTKNIWKLLFAIGVISKKNIGPYSEAKTSGTNRTVFAGCIQRDSE